MMNFKTFFLYRFQGEITMKLQTLTFKIIHIITKHILKKGDSYRATFGTVFKELNKGFNPKKLLYKCS